MRKEPASTASQVDPAPALVTGGLTALFGTIALVIPFGLIGYGAHEAVTQDQAIHSARPVEATVVSGDVRESTGRRGRRYFEPVVVFRYEVGGRPYSSDRSMVLSKRRTREHRKAYAFVAEYPPGAKVTAYYVPREPGRAFLSREYNDSPYVGIFVGLMCLALFLGLGLGYAFHPAAPAPPAEPGWQALSVRRPLKARVRVNLVQGVVYLAVWGWAAWHAFTRVTNPADVAMHLFAWGLALPGLWYLFSGARAHFTRRAVSDARVTLRGQGLRVGGEATVRVEQDLLFHGVLERVRVGLVCEKATGSGKSRRTTVQWQSWTTPAADTRGRRISCTATLAIPADAPASKADGDPRFAWKLVVETALAGYPDYREEFEVRVGPADEEG